jgi:aspartyl-tRNA(Asn)/glutamyl-tRNA(Gln) amidotransferase subunit C
LPVFAVVREWPGKKIAGLYLNFRALLHGREGRTCGVHSKPAEDTANLRKTRIHSRMTAKVTVEDVKRVAELANLELEPEESRHMLHDLNAILDYVAQLNELDTSGITPLAQISELEGATGAGALRADAAQPSLNRSAVLPQAPETDQVFFKVPKVIER